MKRETGLPIAPYAGLAYGTFEDRLRLIGGLSVGFTERFNALLVHDGVNFHPTLNFSYKRHSATVLYIDTQDLGAAYSISF